MVKNKRTGRVVLVAGGLTLLAGGVAFAFWTAGGSGTGTAAAGDVVDISAVQTSIVTGIVPGSAAQSLDGTFLNDNDTPVYVTSVTASISSVTLAVGETGTCDATDFTIANPTMAVNAEALADDTTTWTGATIEFNNKPAVNQDACKGATVNLAYAIS